VKERRKDTRVKLVTPAEIRYSANTVLFYNALVRNVSMGGIALEMERELQVGSVLDIRFRLPNNSAFKAKGAVIWELSSGENQYIHGVNFSKIGLLSSFRLRRFIKNEICK
jgi:hypothetical protein